MKKNVGNSDRIARVMVGLALLGLIFWLDTPWRWAGLVGVMPLFTGLAGRCPACRLLGRSTCTMGERE